MAGGLYPEGSPVFRALQRYRPFICPFEVLIPEVPSGASVLDIGCGAGLFLGLLTAAGSEPRGIGFDVSPHGIKLAQAMSVAGKARLTFQQLDVEAAWPAGEFDVVALIDVLHHVAPNAQEACVRRACTAVKPGGIFLYKDMVSKPFWRAFANRMHDLLLARQWIHYAPVADVQTWVLDERFELQRAARIDRLWYGHELRVFKRLV